jgi:hypothetical protein
LPLLSYTPLEEFQLLGLFCQLFGLFCQLLDELFQLLGELFQLLGELFQLLAWAEQVPQMRELNKKVNTDFMITNLSEKAPAVLGAEY